MILVLTFQKSMKSKFSKGSFCAKSLTPGTIFPLDSRERMVVGQEIPGVRFTQLEPKEPPKPKSHY